MSATVSFEMEFSAGVWTDVSTDVVPDEGIEWSRGIMGSGPDDLVEGPGAMSFVLDNSELNSAGLFGYYTPGHANCRAGFDRNTGVRLKIVAGATTRYDFRGRLADIVPTAGIPAMSLCIAHTWFAEFGDLESVELALIEAGAMDDAVAALVALSPTAPANVDIDAGVSTWPIVFDDVGSKPSPVTVLQRVMESERGYCYLRGNATDGETLRAENRHARALAAVSDTFTTEDLRSISVPSGTKGRVFNDIYVAAVPRFVGTSAEVLVQLAGPVEVQPADPARIFVEYKDPDQRAEHVGGKDMVALAANTHWTANSDTDGGGSDQTASCSAVATFFGADCMIDLTNNAVVTAHFRGPGGADGLQALGLALKRYSPVTMHHASSSSIAIYGKQPLVVTMHYEQSTVSAKAVAVYLAELYGHPGQWPTQIDLATEIPSVLERALQRDVGDKVVVQESQTAVNATCVIHAVHGRIVNNLVHRSFTLAPALAGQAFILDDPAAGDLDYNALGWL